MVTHVHQPVLIETSHKRYDICIQILNITLKYKHLRIYVHVGWLSGHFKMNFRTVNMFV